jgi:ABC-type multidrug transport system ATPase subunit
MQRRIGIAQAMINDPSFLILDEPISHLDDRNSDIMRDIILREAGAVGAAVVTTSIGKHMNIDYDKTLCL